jgi:hypothetical protein
MLEYYAYFVTIFSVHINSVVTYHPILWRSDLWENDISSSNRQKQTNNPVRILVQKLNHFTSSHPISWKRILILSFHWCSHLLWYIFHSGLVNKTNLVHNSFFVCLFLFSTCFGQLCAHHQEKLTVSLRHLVFVALCGWSSGMQSGSQGHPNSDKYLVSYWYSYFSWWWAHSCPKTFTE